MTNKTNKKIGRPNDNTRQVTKLITDIDKYDQDIVTKYKAISLHIADTITVKDIKKASLSQRVTALGILQDKINLKEGKSTEHIAHQVLHSLNPESIKILEDMGKSLIKSILSNEQS